MTSSATGVATVSRSGNTVTVSHVHQTNGEATITVSCTAGTNYSAPASKTVKVTAEFILATLNDNSWAAIHSVSGTGASYWAVGDRKAVAVSGTVGTQAVNGTYYAYIIGFNHNSSKEGNGITFGTFKTALSGGTDICLVDGKYDGYSTNGTKYFNMNHSSNTNSGGWKGCDLRYDVLGSTNTNDGDATATTATNPVANTLMAALPSDLRAVMQPMTIYTDNTGGGSDNASYVIKIGSSGSFTPCSVDEAIGVAFNSEPYNLVGHDEIEGAGTVVVAKCDGGSLVAHQRDLVDELILSALEV